MRIIENAISDELIDACIEEIQGKKKQDVWGISKWKWGVPLQQAYRLTACLSNKPDVHNYNQIRNETTRHFETPASNINYHVWLPGSGIGWHDDDNYSYGATLYLNDWPPEKGAIFMWKEKYTGELNCINPKRNLLVINDCGEDHAVSPVLAGEDMGLRMSIQIFSVKINPDYHE
tara:strand:- start:1858 stop:2382 length:525 start_codon:yes stop_codon:yes gene_type:complete